MSVLRYYVLSLLILLLGNSSLSGADLGAEKATMMGDTVTINISSGSGETGDIVCIDFTVDNFVNVGAGSMQVNFNPYYVMPMCPFDVSNSCFNEGGANNLSEAGLNCNTMDQGFVRLSWFSDALTFDDGCLMFTLCFELKGECGDVSEIAAENDFLDIVFDDLTSAPVVVNPGTIEIVCTDLTCREGHCNPSIGNSDGSIYFWGVGGNPPYSYSVNSGAFTGSMAEFEEVSLDNLPAGMYEIVITDDDGNTCTKNVNLFESSDYPFTLDLSATEVSCFDKDNGTVRIEETIGGIPDFQISWSNGTYNVDSIHRVPPRVYTVTVTDFFGCRVIDSIDLTVDTLFAFAEVIQEPICNGSSDGIINVTATGGTPGAGSTYIFKIEGIDEGNFYDDEIAGVPSAQFEDIPNGTYEITVCDSARIACDSDPIYVTFDSGPNFTVDIISDIDSCVGGNATVTFTPSVPGTYIPMLITEPDSVIVTDVVDGPFGLQALDLAPGIYNLKLTDFFNDCFLDTLFEVPDIDPLTIIVDAEEPGCGGNDGFIHLTVSGGTPDYTFDWNIDSNGGPDRDNLGGGDYSVTISDASGCQDSFATSFMDGDVIPLNTFIVQAISCFNGDDGIVGAEVTGSTDYTFTWSDGTNNLGTGSPLENLSTGTYYVTAEDADGCATTDSVFLANPVSDILLDITQSGPLCPGDNGVLTPIATSGVEPFIYTWKDAITEEVLLEGQAFTGQVGQYLLCVRDGLGCTFDSLVTMEPPSNAIQLMTSNIVGVSCFGTCDGSFTVEATGGADPDGSFIYVVSGVMTPMNSADPVTFDGLCAGENWVIAVDAFCPSDTLFFTIPDQELVGIDTTAFTIIPPSCAGDSDGSIDLVLEGVDINDATITWVGQGVTGPSINNIPSGTYEIFIEYGSGCTLTDSITLQDNDPLIVDIDPLVTVGINCSNSNSGRIQLIVEGGSPAYTYDWVPNISTSDLATDLGPGTYEVTVTDSNGCEADTSYTLTSAPPVVATIPDAVEPDCYGEQTCITVTEASGGVGDYYTFTINNGPRYELDTCVNLFAGSYLITVFDSVGCSFQTNISIDQPEELLVTAGPDQTINIGESSEPISAQIVSFLDIDSIGWSPTESLVFETPDMQIVTASPAGTTTYTVTVTDEAGCTASDDVTVAVEFKRNVYRPNAFSPNNDDINDNFQLVVGNGVVEVLDFQIYDRWGNIVHNEQNYMPDDVVNKGWNGEFQGQPVNPGVYVFFAEVLFIDGARVKYTGDVTLVR